MMVFVHPAIKVIILTIQRLSVSLVLMVVVVMKEIGMMLLRIAENVILMGDVSFVTLGSKKVVMGNVLNVVNTLVALAETLNLNHSIVPIVMTMKLHV